MNLEEQNLNKPQKPQLNIGAVSGSLPTISIDKVPVYLKCILDYCRSKGIDIDDKELIKKLWYEYDLDCYLSKSNSACPECKSTDIKIAIHTDYKECNKCSHFWEADC